MREEFRKKEKQKNNQASDKKQKNSSFWDEQYIKKAEEMERELFADGGTDAYDPTDEEEARSYQELINRLKADGIYQEDETEPGTKRKIIPLHRKIHFGKVAGVAILCCACIFAASMTSEANRNYLINNIRVWSGKDTRTVIGNSEKNENINMAEYEAIEEIEDELDIEMPEFYYRPGKFEFFSYEISEMVGVARVEYQYGENIIVLYVDIQNENTASKSTSMHGEKNKTIIKNKEGINIELERIQDKQDKMPSYTAQWEMGNIIYSLSGKMDEKEFIDILENMVF